MIGDLLTPPPRLRDSIRGLLQLIWQSMAATLKERAR